MNRWLLTWVLIWWRRNKKSPLLWGGCPEGAGEGGIKYCFYQRFGEKEQSANLIRHGERRATFPKGEGFVIYKFAPQPP